MKNLNASLPAKIAAVFLVTVSAVLGAFSGAAVIYMYEYGYYTGMTVMLDGMTSPVYLPELNRVLAFSLVDGAVFLVLLVFLLCSAGHRRGTEGIVLNWQDKIPLDLYLAGAGAASLLLLNVGVSVFYSDLLLLTGSALLFTAVFLICLAVLMTIAARLKAGLWWHNTVIYRGLGLIKKLLDRLASAFRLFPLVWRTGLIFCGATFFNFLLAVWFFNNGDFLPFLIGVLFNGFLLYAFCRVSLGLQKLRAAGERLASGDADYKVDTRGMYWDFRRHGENLNRVGEGIALAVERQMKSERLKTELITNVSHDIKTPLTSIINYVDLLKKEGLEGKGGEYLEVLDRQSRRLQKLTEDLVEASKASTGNLPVELRRTDVCELLRQAAGEYAERLEAGGLEAVLSAPQAGLFVMADGRLLWRVLDNLLSNACKYSLSGTRVYIDVERQADEAAVTVKNISRSRLNVDADELMERFVRGESSRTTEGSGLGLNIARSLAELQKGSFRLAVDGDLFKAELRFKTVS